MWKWLQDHWKPASRWVWAALAVLAISALRSWSGHEGTVTVSPPVLDRPPNDVPWKRALWDQVLVPDNALLHRPEYLLADPDFLDPLNRKLDELYFRDRHPPENRAERQAYLAFLLAAYDEALRSPAGLARLEQRVAGVFASPQVISDPAAGTVVADFGAVPGTLSPDAAGGFVVTKSEHLDEHRLPKSDFVAGHLAKLAREHPQAAEVLVRLCPLHDDKAWFCEYRYRREIGNNGSVTGLLTVSPPADKRSPFYREWTHVVHDDRFDRWTRAGYDLHQSLRDQAPNALAGAMLEMDVPLVLVIHAADATGAPVWRPDNGEVAIRTIQDKWMSTALQQVPRLHPQAWGEQKIAAWPPGEVESSQLAERAGQWETESPPGSRGETAVSTPEGTRYELAQGADHAELVRLVPGTAPEVMVKLADGCRHLALSPDGAWLALHVEKLGVLLVRITQDAPAKD